MIDLFIWLLALCFMIGGVIACAVLLLAMIIRAMRGIVDAIKG